MNLSAIVSGTIKNNMALIALMYRSSATGQAKRKPEKRTDEDKQDDRPKPSTESV